MPVRRYARPVPATLAVSGLSKRYGPSRRSAASISRSRTASWSGCWARTAREVDARQDRRRARQADERQRPSSAGEPAGSRAARASLGYLAELFRFPGWYTADEVLELHQRLSGSTGGARERQRLLELVALADAAAPAGGGMSKGMQQRLGIAQALVGEPRLLLLDEPTSALDPVGRRTVRELLEELRGRGVSVLLNSHLLSEVELVCDRVVILLGGEVVAAGAPGRALAPARRRARDRRGRAT